MSEEKGEGWQVYTPDCLLTVIHNKYYKNKLLSDGLDGPAAAGKLEVITAPPGGWRK